MSGDGEDDDEGIVVAAAAESPDETNDDDSWLGEEDLKVKYEILESILSTHFSKNKF